MKLTLLVVPYDTAQRGLRMGAGPLRLLDGGLARYLEASFGAEVNVKVIDVPPEPPPAEIRTAFELNHRLALAVRAALLADSLPVVLTGNCNSALGVAGGLQDPKLILAWFDAHADFNTPTTTESGFFDGTALATVVGHCWQRMASKVPGFSPIPEANVLLLGARDIDLKEGNRLNESEITWLTPEKLPGELQSCLVSIKRGRIHSSLHIDLDVLDPSEGQANRFPAPGGLSKADLLSAIGTIGQATRVQAVTLSAYDPEFDTTGRLRNTIFEIACAAVRATLHGQTDES